jgi:DNA-binding MarR family transcriptional regulator
MTATDDPLSALDPRLADHTSYLAREAVVRAESCLRATLPPGHTLRDLAVLTVLAVRPLSQSQLGTLLRVNRTVMISVIDGIEAAGYACRDRDPADRRRYALRITDEGRAALQRLHAAATEAERNLPRRLNELLRRLVPDLVETLPAELTALTAFLLEHVSLQLRARSEQALTSRGMKPRCVRMLVALDATQPCTQERLAGAMSVAAPTIVGALDELHVNGLIERNRNPSDRREHVLRLSTDGRSYLSDALHAEDTEQKQLAGLLGAKETLELNTLLAAVVAYGRTQR